MSDKLKEAIEKLKWLSEQISPSPIKEAFDTVVAELEKPLLMKWISVIDEMPTRNENVLLKRDIPFNRYLITGFQRNGVFYSNETAEQLIGVIAWMQLKFMEATK